MAHSHQIKETLLKYLSFQQTIYIYSVCVWGVMTLALHAVDALVLDNLHNGCVSLFDTILLYFVR